MLKIGVDAMGGDFAPEAAVKGAVMALGAVDAESRIVLFGGGFPYIVDGTVAGGIGVSGGTVEQDMEIARYAMLI